MRPKIFIGSSVEGKSVAYSIQQNLTHDAEVTVWDQGVFEISRTTIESLLDVLRRSDFGIFVFSPDDTVIMRGDEHNVVRDNVLFELGLFIGKLSRERVFFIIPSNMELRIPTDLFGITPGKYDPHREDGNLQAAMGPVCYQIGLQIKKLGPLFPSEDVSKTPDVQEQPENRSDDWILAFLNKEYDKASQKIESLLDLTNEVDKKLDLRIWLAYCHFKIDADLGAVEFTKLLEDNSEKTSAYTEIARVYLWENYLGKAISVLERGLQKFEVDDTLVNLLAECYEKESGLEKASIFLEKYTPNTRVDIGLKLCEIYLENKDLNQSRGLIHQLYLNYPNDERIRYQYAKIAIEIGENEIALFLLKSLTAAFPKNATYWGYLSNCCVNLDLYDLALVSCRESEKITDGKEEWILSNIGNMLKNKGFYSEGIKYLERGIEINKDSSYAHDRLATTIKLRDEERKRVNDLSLEGRKKILAFNMPNMIN